MPTIEMLIRASGLSRIDARLLLQYLLKVEHPWLIAHSHTEVPAAITAQFKIFASRRAAGEPIAYLLGGREFYGHWFEVNPAVLIPRPETELLVESALAHASAACPIDVVDVGTGSGCIAISVKKAAPRWSVTGVDCSLGALAVARRNGERLQAPIHWLHGHWLEPLAHPTFDLILSNPPYIAAGDLHLSALQYEPAEALTDGADGLTAYRFLIAAAPSRLKAGGALMLEHGYDQAKAVCALLTAAGATMIKLQQDLAGQPRVTLAYWGNSQQGAGL